DTNYDKSYSDSDSEFVTEIENLPILNFDIDTYQDVKNKILQQNSDNENEYYDLNNTTEENISSEFDEEIEEILLDQSITNNKYTPCVIVDNDNNERRIQQCNRIDEGGSNQPLAQLKGTWEIRSGVSKFGCNNKHDDLSAILEKFRNWIQLVAKSDNKLQKQQLIWSLLPAIKTLKLAFKLAKIDLSDKAKVAFLKEKDCAHFGNLLRES
ncbi:23297_t:CDS:2, partial [Gigaspora margarita]